MNIDRKELYSVDYVLSIIASGVEYITLDGDIIRLTSKKYKMFLEKGVECVSCDLVGMFFAKERDIIDKRNIDQDYYLRLYGINGDGEEILITKDHIHPKSRGGPDIVENLQTMCIKCNHGKGNKFGDEDEQYIDGRSNFSD